MVKARTKRPSGRLRRLTIDEAVLAVLLAAMDANQHVSREEAARAHHIIWSMRRFRERAGEAVGRLIDRVRERMEKAGTEAVLDEAVRVLPARLRPPAFAVAVDLMLADARLERAERQFVTKLAGLLKIRPDTADDIVRGMLVKNGA